MKIVTVLKSGGDFDREYVERIAAAVPSCYDFICLSDDPLVPGYVPLKYNYPLWWSKMEIFRPDIIHDSVFYVDLDTVIVDDISEELSILEQWCDHFVMLSDFYFPQNVASGVMYVPGYLRSAVWHSWILREPDRVIDRLRGDQDFLRELYNNCIRFEQVVDSDWVCSYKAHVTKTHPPHIRPRQIDASRSKIICFHGKPRPRDVNWELPDAF